MRMREYQASRPLEEKVDHMQAHARAHRLTRAGVAAMHERVKWLGRTILSGACDRWSARSRRPRVYDTGPGYGRCSIASNGMWCAS